MTSDPPPTIDQQIREVEAVYLSREAWLRQRREAVANGRTVPPDTGCAESGMPCLSAAIQTLRWVRDNKDALKTAARQGAAA